MIKIVYTKIFLKSARRLPPKIQEKLSKLLSFLEENPFNRLLHTKHLTGELAGFFSFRITRDWRVVFQFLEPGVIKLIDVSHRKDIYK